MTAAECALELVKDGMVVGLGSGRAAGEFVRALGTRVAAGLRVRGVPTSHATAHLATQLGIPLTALDEADGVDLTVDGADEVDPSLDLIKGRGGALVREKIVAAAAQRVVILVGPEKLVTALGSRGLLPVEVVPFGLASCQRRLRELGYASEVRRRDGEVFLTDNGNAILDCRVSALPDPAGLERALLAVPGVVGTGLFLDLADTLFIEDDETVRVVKRA